MKLKHIVINNFRKYENACFVLHPHLTVLIGENGKGKTTILDALAIMLGTFFQGSGIKAGQGVVRKDDNRIVYRRKEGQLFREMVEAELQVKVILNEEELQWTRKVGDRGGEAKEIISSGAQLLKRVKNGEDVTLPLFLYYGAGRLWKGHRNIISDRPSSQLDAYRFCLDPASDQHALEKWFMRLSLAELQKDQPSLALKAVRNAVMTCIPHSTSFFFDMEETQIMLEMNDSVMPFSKLSDGYRNVLAMVADMAHRCARLNPHLGENAALETEGIVLIDEMDLHLHPKWQRCIISDLQKSFPKMQFVVTSHSPFILQSVGDGAVINLNHDASIYGEAPTISHLDSKSIEDLVEVLMGIPIPQRSQRYQDMYETAIKYYQLLQGVETSETDEKDALKKQLDQLSAPFSDNIAYHAFLEMKRTASGLNIEDQRSES